MCFHPPRTHKARNIEVDPLILDVPQFISLFALCVPAIDFMPSVVSQLTNLKIENEIMPCIGVTVFRPPQGKIC